MYKTLKSTPKTRFNKSYLSPMLCSKDFDEDPHWSVIRELLSQTFGVPNKHPKSQPFFDRVYTFAIADDRIWFRHYQIVEEDGSLAEIGPRFVLNPIKVGTMWDFISYWLPSQSRESLKISSSLTIVK